LGHGTSGRVYKLEHLFEDRVAKALHRLGMPSLIDIQMLSDRVAQLETQLQALQSGTAGTSASGSTRSATQAAKKARPRASSNAPAAARRKKSA
jgi:hypothetical protein